MSGETDISVAMRRQNRSHLLGRAVAELAGRQHGVLTRRQLVDLGSSRSSIDRAIRAGRLHPIHPGVYAVGHRKLTRHGWWMAAALAGGPDGVLSHRPAGAAWNLRAWGGKQAITVPRWKRSTSILEMHCSNLPADETTTCEGIPITTVPRTILDLASILDPHQLLNAINEAEVQELRHTLSLPDMLELHRGERGTAKLRSVLAHAGYGVSERELEELFARFIAERNFPRPELNAWVHVGGQHYSPDCLWRAERLVVELHSARYHGTTPAISRDATRDRRLLMAGWQVIHVTWAQLNDRREAAELERDLRFALDRGWAANRSAG